MNSILVEKRYNWRSKLYHKAQLCIRFSEAVGR